MRRLFLIALALVAFAFSAQVADARAPADFVGVTAEDVFAGSQAYRLRTLGTQRSLGIRLIRQTIDWSTIEYAPGRYDLSVYDVYVASLAARRMRLLPILFRAPSFYRRAKGRNHCPPRNNKTMAAFAQVLVRRYGPKGSLWKQRPNLPKTPIRAWQIWNEPNLKLYWCGKQNPRAYVRMLKTVGRGIEKVDRKAEIVTAGLPDSRLRSAIRLTPFLKRLYKAKARRYFDTLAVNSYATNTRQLAKVLRATRKLMNRRRDRRAKIWITEIGWGDKGPKHRFIVGAKGQTKRITKSVAYIRKQRRRLRLRGFVYFAWRDGAPYAPNFDDQWGLHTGLLGLSGTLKPSFDAFERAIGKIK